jgi:hypothetical protein
MASAYLYLNAVLYLVFAIWCSVAPASTAQNLGYKSLSSGGHSEYLLARNPSTLRLGLLIAVTLYAPIVLYRVITVVRFWPVSVMTVGTGILELSLLVAALAIFYART